MPEQWNVVWFQLLREIDKIENIYNRKFIPYDHMIRLQ